jgi:hypothetical protein
VDRANALQASIAIASSGTSHIDGHPVALLDAFALEHVANLLTSRSKSWYV